MLDNNNIIIFISFAFSLHIYAHTHCLFYVYRPLLTTMGVSALSNTQGLGINLSRSYIRKTTSRAWHVQSAILRKLMKIPSQITGELESVSI